MANSIANLFNSPSTEIPAYISGGVLPVSGIMLMGGEAKIGKTFLLSDLAHNLAVGGALWGSDYKVIAPVAVHYFEQEVGEVELQRRVKLRYTALGSLPPANFYYSSRLQDFFLDTKEGIRILKEELCQSGALVAIIDPISRCMNGNENTNNEVGELFKRLDELLGTLPRLSIILSHHFGKPPRNEIESGVDPLSPYNFRGASKWFDAPDTLLTLARTVAKPGEWRRLKYKIEVRQGESMDEVRNVAILDGGIVESVQHSALTPATKQTAWKL